jgi:flagella basal body P-ring formation protein FlgA
MTRRCRLALAIVLAAAAGAADATAATPAVEAAPPVALRAMSIVAGPGLMLGDLFDHIGGKAGVRIGDAPAAGGSLVLDAGRLAAIARAHGIDWRPASAAEKVVVERDSVPVTAEEIAAHILVELTHKGLATDALTVEPTTGSRQLYRPRNAHLAVEAVSTDPAGRRFSAVVAIVGDGQPRQTLPIAGRIDRAVRIPVLARALRPGEPITAADLAWHEMADRQVPANAVREPAALVGQAARRALAPRVPVLVSDLRSTRIVGKGQPVMLILEVPGMQLTAGGIAQEDGGPGDLVRVVNDRSRTVIQGVVSGPGTVIVAAGPGASVNAPGAAGAPSRRR